MTVVTGNIQDIGMAPLSGSLEARSAEFRASGDVLIAPEARAFPVVAGAVEADLLPGPVRVTISVGSHARETFDVIVPESGPASLASLVEDAAEWSPQVVSEVAAHRQAAEEAASRAEAAAEDVGDAIAGAADAVVAEVEADRVAAEQAAAAASSSAAAADSSAGDASDAAGAAAGSASEAAGSASAAASSASAAAGSATDAAGSASDAAGAVVDARAARDAAEGHASAAAGSASSAAGSAVEAGGHADRAEAAANEFGLTASSSTLAPGSQATVTVTGDGPAYQVAFGIPQGAKGDKGDEGEISQAQLDAAVASLVDGAPEALNTLSELAQALGDDPNFATTISTQIGQRALIDGAPVEYDSLGKLVSALIAGELGGSTDGIAVGDPPEGESLPPTTAGVAGVAVGSAAQAGGYSAAVGVAAQAGDYSAAIGSSASAAGVGSAAIGMSASAAGDYSAAIGAQASADGMASVAIGMEASADGMDSAAIGSSASAAGEGSAAIGALASAPDDWTIAIGAHPSSGMAHHVTIPGSLDVAGKAVSTDDHTHTPASLGAVARSGSATTLWSGTAAQYAALAEATKNAAGFVAVITP